MSLCNFGLYPQMRCLSGFKYGPLACILYIAGILSIKAPRVRPRHKEDPSVSGLGMLPVGSCKAAFQGAQLYGSQKWYPYRKKRGMALAYRQGVFTCQASILYLLALNQHAICTPTLSHRKKPCNTRPVLKPGQRERHEKSTPVSPDTRHFFKASRRASQSPDIPLPVCLDALAKTSTSGQPWRHRPARCRRPGLRVLH